MTDLYQQAQAWFKYSQAIRRDLHRHPEMGFQEVRTAGIVAKELRELGLEVTTGVAKTGVIAMIDGASPGPTVLVRVDMDALPIQEETGKEYASTQAGVMHACGHDGHVAVGLTVARLLLGYRSVLRGQVKLVFQPAEEGLDGAEGMIAAGVLENPKPAHTLGLHIWNEKPVGWVGVVPGPLMAGGEMFTIRLTGKGGHGALPHLAVDPINAAAQVITGLQSIISRNVSPLESAVISVTMVHSGDAFNIIPQKAELRGTIRTFEPLVRELVLARFREVVSQIAGAMGCTSEIDLVRLTPPVINDPQVAERIAAQVRMVLPQADLDTDFRTMVSEDMAFMMEKVPGCYLMVGGANPALGLDFPHHHPKFDFDETALVWASATLSAAVLEMLK